MKNGGIPDKLEVRMAKRKIEPMNIGGKVI